MSKGNEKVLAKVAGLLALSNDNPTDHEGQSAMLLAQKLLATHNLTMEDVELLEDGSDASKEVVEMDGTEWTRLAWWQKALASTIADNFRCHCVMHTGGGKRKVVFIGVKSDAEVATEVYKYALADIKYQSKKFLDSRGAQVSRAKSNAIKNDYIAGYLTGLSDKFKEQVAKEGWGLILVKGDEVVAYYKNLDTRSEGSKTRTTAKDNGAQDAGYSDGKSFNPQGKKIG